MVVLTLLIVAAGIRVYEDLFAANVVPEANKGFLYFRSGVSFDRNFEMLSDRRILKNAYALKRLIKLFGYSDLVKPGRYRINMNMSNIDLLRLLVSGRQEPLDIVFKYAERKGDMAAFWSRQLEADSIELLDWMNHPDSVRQFGLDTSQSILFFIPNTYNFYWNTPSSKLIQRMALEYNKFWNEGRDIKAGQLNLTRAMVGILASIVQKETARRDEMPIIAGVYYNRLALSFPLQADPTVIYAMNDKRIRRVYGEMLNNPSPYNTYRHSGLPPGPICVPSVQAIDAVLNMARHRYLYFCAREDFSGYHNFAATYSAHRINALRYQHELNRRAIH